MKRCVLGALVIERVEPDRNRVVLVRLRVIARFPHPCVFLVVAAAAVTSDGDLGKSTQASAVLPAASLGLNPSRVVKAAAHAHIRAATHAERRVECPAELCASKG